MTLPAPSSASKVAGLDGRTKRARMLRDLYRARIEALDDDVAADLTVQAAVRRAVELMVIADSLRAEMLSATEYDPRLGKDLVRVENLVRRAETDLAELLTDASTPESWYERQQRDRANEN